MLRIFTSAQPPTPRLRARAQGSQDSPETPSRDSHNQHRTWSALVLRGGRSSRSSMSDVSVKSISASGSAIFRNVSALARASSSDTSENPPNPRSFWPVHQNALNPSLAEGGTHDQVACMKDRSRRESGPSANVSCVPEPDVRGLIRRDPVRGYARSATLFTGGIVHVPSMIDGLLSFGQYMRSIRMNLPAGAGSQFDSLFAPGESFWM